MAKLAKEIENTYTNERDLIKGCESLRNTVYDICIWNWKHELRSKKRVFFIYYFCFFLLITNAIIATKNSNC